MCLKKDWKKRRKVGRDFLRVILGGGGQVDGTENFVQDTLRSTLQLCVILVWLNRSSRLNNTRIAQSK